MANVQTYTRLTAPPSISLACMALRLAEQRAYEADGDIDWLGFRSKPGTEPPTDREDAQAQPDCNPVSLRYYEIIDRIARGEKP